MVQAGALAVQREGKELGLVQSEEEMAVGATHSSPPVEGKRSFLKA